MARVIEFGPGCDIPAARRRPSAAEARGLAYDAEVKAETDPLYEQVKDFITPMEWPAIAPFVFHINRMKKAKGKTWQGGEVRIHESLFRVRSVDRDPPFEGRNDLRHDLYLFRETFLGGCSSEKQRVCRVEP